MASPPPPHAGAGAYAELNGCRMHYLDWRHGVGGEPGAPVLMVHGLTQHAHSFDGLATHLTQREDGPRRRCIALDVRGRGLSDWASPDTYGVPTYVRDVLALLEHLGLDRVHYVGTSMGGIVGMSLGLEHAGRFLSMTFNDIGPTLPVAGLTRLSSNLGDREGSFADLDEYLDKAVFPYFGFLAERDRGAMLAAAKWAVKTNPDGTLSVRYDPAITRGALDPESLAKVEPLLWEGFRRLGCPLMVVRGGESDLLPAETLQAMREAQPALQSVEVPGVSHAPTLDEEGIPEAIAAFLDNAEAAPGA